MGCWPLVVPVIPVLFALGLMQILGVPIDLPDTLVTGWSDGLAQEMRHAGDRINFASVVAIHTGVCFFAMVYFALELRRSAASNLKKLSFLIGLMVAIVLGLMIAMAQLDPVPELYLMSYFFVEQTVSASGVAADLITSTWLGISPLVLACLFPSILGIVSTLMASGVVYTILQRVDGASDAQWARTFHVNLRLFMRCFYVLSAVLVTSTAAALLFYKIPVGMIAPTDDAASAAAAYAGFASSAATFWGAIYTLTLLFVFAAPFAVLFLKAKLHVEALEEPKDLRVWLQEHGFSMTIGETLKNTVFALAPLLVGPLGDLAKGFG